MYEYATMVGSIGLTKKVEEATPDEITKAITIGLGKTTTNIMKAYDTFQGGGWEIISHQITLVSHTLVVTYLARRPKQPKPS